MVMHREAWKRISEQAKSHRAVAPKEEEKEEAASPGDRFLTFL